VPLPTPTTTEINNIQGKYQLKLSSIFHRQTHRNITGLTVFVMDTTTEHAYINLGPAIPKSITCKA
jgi:hypothetical protein